MWLKNKRAQSTAEYAIIIGLIVAVAAGVLSTAVRTALREKNKKAINYLLSAGEDVADFKKIAETAEKIFSEELRATDVLSGDANFKDVTALHKGGAEKRHLLQKTKTEVVAVEAIDEQVR